MTHAMLTAGISTATLFGVIARPRGLHEAWWAVLGAALLLVFGCVSARDALAAIVAVGPALLLLVALLAFAALVARSGFFEWAAIETARLARGDAVALYRNTFLLAAVVTATLSLDTTAVILTPLVLASVRRARLPARPYVFACIFVANAGSLLLPISNLTNVLYAHGYQQSFLDFAARMLVPQIAVLGATYALCRRIFRHELPARFSDASLRASPSAVPHRGYFRATVATLVVVVAGCFLAPLAGIEPYAVVFGGALLLACAGAATGRLSRGAMRAASLGVVPFVLGLFVITEALAETGAFAFAARTFDGAPGGVASLFAAECATAFGANVLNNLPAALIAERALGRAAGAPAVYGALLGANVGPLLTVFGSLATLLVLDAARKDGVEVRATDLLRLGALVTPVLLAVAGLALAATFAVVP